MPTLIDQKITNFSVKKQEKLPPEKETFWLEQMGEHIERPEVLFGSTTKIKSPNTDHAVYVTINDVILNQGTEHEKRLPYEVFIQSKDNEHTQWINILARAMSAIFRKGGDITFIIQEMKDTHSPRSGYFKKGKFVPSLVAEIGLIVENHLIRIGYIKGEEKIDKEKVIEEAKEFVATTGEFPPNAILCKKCNNKAAIMMDNCLTCLNCGDSKCG